MTISIAIEIPELKRTLTFECYGVMIEEKKGLFRCLNPRFKINNPDNSKHLKVMLFELWEPYGVTFEGDTHDELLSIMKWFLHFDLNKKRLTKDQYIEAYKNKDYIRKILTKISEVIEKQVISGLEQKMKDSISTDDHEFMDYADYLIESSMKVSKDFETYHFQAKNALSDSKSTDRQSKNDFLTL